MSVPFCGLGVVGSSDSAGDSDSFCAGWLGMSFSPRTEGLVSVYGQLEFTVVEGAISGAVGTNSLPGTRIKKLSLRTDRH